MPKLPFFRSSQWPHKSKSRRSVWVILLILCFFFGGWGGFEIRDELTEKGCLALPRDIASYPIATASENSVKFIALGDTGTGNADQQQVANAAQRVCEAQGCDFFLLLGDNIYPDGVQSINDPQFQTAFEIPYAAIDKPFFVVLGNHDTRGDALSQVLYSLKSSRWRMPNFHYSFQAGPAQFFAINSTCSLLPWYASEESMVPNAELWTFAFAHHPIYGSGTHGDADAATRWFWGEFLQNRMDFFLSGHNHHLEHLQVEGEPTEYVISGAGGKHYRSPQEKAKTQPSEAESLFVYQDVGFVWFHVQPAQVEAKFFDGQAQELYQFTKKRTSQIATESH